MLLCSTCFSGSELETTVDFSLFFKTGKVGPALENTFYPPEHQQGVAVIEEALFCTLEEPFQVRGQITQVIVGRYEPVPDPVHLIPIDGLYAVAPAQHVTFVDV